MAAFRKAQDVFGPKGVVGYGHVDGIAKEPVFYVGKVERGAFVYFGAGNDWPEAFKNTRRVLFHFAQRLVLEEIAYDKQSAPKPLT